MINVHMDTVGVAGMEDPFSGELRDGRIWGRGSQDIKSGIAAVLGMARALKENEVHLKGDLVLAFVADEEHESLGTRRLIEEVRTVSAIVVEPTELDVCIAHRGFGVFRLRTTGRSAHGGQSEIGIDANLHMGHVLVELDTLRQRWEDKYRHPMLGSATLHTPVISGGRHLYVYADECFVDVEVRTVPGEQTRDEVEGDLRKIMDRLGDRIDGFQGTVEPVIWRSPFEVDPERPIVRAVKSSAERVRNAPVQTIAHGWWEDSGLLGEAGIDTVIIGPTGKGLHSEVEWVEADSVVSLALILYHSVISYCGEQ